MGTVRTGRLWPKPPLFKIRRLGLRPLETSFFFSGRLLHSLTFNLLRQGGRDLLILFKGLRGYREFAREFALLTPSTQRAQRLKHFKISLRDWNFQATNLRLKFSIAIENFKRTTQQGPFLWGIIKVGIEIFKRDWNFQSRLKVSSLDWKFQAYGLKISRDQSGFNFSIAGPSGDLGVDPKVTKK